MEPPTLAATTIRIMRAVCVMPVEDEDNEDGVALALAEEVSVINTTVWDVAEATCVGVAVVEGVTSDCWAIDDDNWELAEVDDVEDDEETEVVVVGRSALTTLPNSPPEVY